MKQTSDQDNNLRFPKHSWAITERAAPTKGFDTRIERVREGDSLSRLFSRQNLSPQLLRALIQSEKGDHRVSRLKVGQTVEFRYAADSALAELAVIQSPFHQTVAIYRDNTWSIEQRHREARITSSRLKPQ